MSTLSKIKILSGDEIFRYEWRYSWMWYPAASISFGKFDIGYPATFHYKFELTKSNYSDQERRLDESFIIK